MKDAPVQIRSDHNTGDNDNNEMIYEMDHICTADMKSSEAMIAVVNAIFANA